MSGGTGPARVVWFRFTHGGRKFSHIANWVRASGKSSIDFTTASISLMVLAPNEERMLLKWKLPADQAGLARWQLIDRQRFTAKVEACYCSVFDQCWVSNLEADLPKPISSCGASEPTGATPPTMRRS